MPNYLKYALEYIENKLLQSFVCSCNNNIISQGSGIVGSTYLVKNPVFDCCCFLASNNSRVFPASSAGHGLVITILHIQGDGGHYFLGSSHHGLWVAKRDFSGVAKNSSDRERAKKGRGASNLLEQLKCYF